MTEQGTLLTAVPWSMSSRGGTGGRALRAIFLTLALAHCVACAEAAGQGGSAGAPLGTQPRISATQPGISATQPRISATQPRISATQPRISATQRRRHHLGASLDSPGPQSAGWHPLGRESHAGEHQAAEPAVAPMSISMPLTHSLASLPGSSHQGQATRGRSVMSAEHATLLARLTHERGRRLSLTYDVSQGAYLPLQGNADPQIAGLYWTELEVGQPAQKFKVQVDSGSNLIWVSCKPCQSCAPSLTSPPFDPAASSSSSVLNCGDEPCNSFQKSESQIPPGCLAAETQDSKCYYWLVYGDGSSTTGYLLQDVMHYRQLDGSLGNLPITFGCGYNQTGNLVQPWQSVDGLMGLGRGAVSLMMQMSRMGLGREVFAVCLGGEAQGGGSLILGPVTSGGFSYTRLYTPNTHYAAWLNGISVAGQRLQGIDASTFGQSNGGDGRVVLDTGTTLAIVPEVVYNALIAAITSAALLPQLGDPDFLCFNYGSRPYGDLPKYFPTVSLHFEDADMVLPPANYLFVKDDTAGSSACLGWTSGPQTILGDIVLHDMLITFDIDNNKLGWAPFDCAQGRLKASGPYNTSIIVGLQDISNSALGLERQLTSGLAFFLITLTTVTILFEMLLPVWH